MGGLTKVSPHIGSLRPFLRRFLERAASAAAASSSSRCCTWAFHANRQPAAKQSSPTPMAEPTQTAPMPIQKSIGYMEMSSES